MQLSRLLLLTPALLASAQITEIVDGVTSIVSEITSAGGEITSLGGSIGTRITSIGGSLATVSLCRTKGWKTDANYAQVVTDEGGDIISTITSGAEALGTRVTSVGGSLVTEVRYRAHDPSESH